MCNKKERMSPEEETYLCHLISQERLTTRQTLLLEAAEQLYGKKVKELPPKADMNYEAGASVLEKKVLSHFRKLIEYSHFSMTQLFLNMGKLTGNENTMYL